MAKKPSSHPKRLENHRKPWTPADETKLEKLAKENTPTRVMAIELGRSPVAVQDHASEMGVSLKPVNRPPRKPKK